MSMGPLRARKCPAMLPGEQYRGSAHHMNFDNIADQAKNALGEHGDKVSGGIDKAADAAKSRFGDHSDTIDSVAGKAQEFVGGQSEGGQQQGGQYGQ